MTQLKIGNIGKKYNQIRRYMKTSAIEKRLAEMIEKLLCERAYFYDGLDEVRNIAICELYIEVCRK